MPVRQPRQITLTGPWGGMEERAAYRKPTQCTLAINCNFADGTIKARDGFRRIYDASTAIRWQLHVVKKDGDAQYIIGVGFDSSDNKVKFASWRPSGAILSSIITLDGDRNHHGRTPSWRCSFVDVIIGHYDSLINKRVHPHRVTLIVTPSTTYKFDADGDSTTVTKVDVSKDAVKDNKVNIAYIKHEPRARFAVDHFNAVVYAGFSPGQAFELDQNLDDEQNLVPEQHVNGDSRSRYSLGPQFGYIGDPHDPVGVRGDRYFRVGDREQITGLASFQETLVVFTDEAIYSGTGFGESFALRPVAKGVGCVSHDSIVEVAGALYFMSHDGVYMFHGGGPQGGVAKISKPIDSLFSGRHQNSFISEEIATLMSGLGWPFTAAATSLELSQGLHVQSSNQIWWSIPITNESAGAYSVTLVFDYINMAWSYNVPNSAAIPSCMFSGVTFKSGNKERVVTSTSDGDLLEYGWYIDGTDGATVRGIPFVYQTGRLMADKDYFGTLSTVRLKMLSGGKNPSSNKPRWFFDGEESHYDGYVNNVAQADSARQAVAGDLRTHPGADDEDGATDNTYFWNATTWNGSKWVARDWWSNEIEHNSVKSRSFRLGIVDNPDTTDRDVAVNVQAITIAYSNEDNR